MWSFSWTIADPAVMEASLSNGGPQPSCATLGLRHVEPHRRMTRVAYRLSQRVHQSRCFDLAPYSDLVRLPHMVYFRTGEALRHPQGMTNESRTYGLLMVFCQ